MRYYVYFCKAGKICKEKLAQAPLSRSLRLKSESLGTLGGTPNRDPQSHYQPLYSHYITPISLGSLRLKSESAKFGDMVPTGICMVKEALPRSVKSFPPVIAWKIMGNSSGP